MTTSFSSYLTDLLSRRGQAATLSSQSGVPTSYISKICKGDVLPSPDVLTKLIKPMIEADKAFLVREYLLLHLPENAPMVKVIVNDEDGPRDRLQRAIDALDPVTRDSLAVLVEAVNRAPEQGARALQAVGLWFQSVPMPSSSSDGPAQGGNSLGSPSPRGGVPGGAEKDLSLAAEAEATYGGEAGEGEGGDEVEAAQRAAARAFLKKTAGGGGDAPPAPGTGSVYPAKGTRAVGRGDNL